MEENKQEAAAEELDQEVESQDSQDPAEESSSQPEVVEETEQEKLQKVESDLLYLRAEFENYRKRMLRDKEQSVRFANERFIGEVLRVYNDFERCLEHGKQHGESENAEFKGFFDGVLLIRNEMEKMLGQFGVKFTGSEGEEFDPNQHEALSQVPGPADKEGKVVQVVQKGCLLHDRLITPAKVLVGAPGAEQSNQSNGEDS